MVDMFIGSIIGIVILATIVILVKFVSKGTLLASLRGGVPLVDKAGTGKICELLDYEENISTHKVRLRINFFGDGGIKQTGFWFDPKLDFYPSIDQVRWEDYMGTIICYKDLETGSKDYRDDEMKFMEEKVKSLMRANRVYKRIGIEVYEYFEKQKVEPSQEKEVVKYSKALNAIKKLANAGDEGINREDLKGLGLGLVDE